MIDLDTSKILHWLVYGFLTKIEVGTAEVIELQPQQSQRRQARLQHDAHIVQIGSKTNKKDIFIVRLPIFNKDLSFQYRILAKFV